VGESESDAAGATQPIKRVGRYAVFQQIAAGGMATVHLARLAGPEGFRRVVAVKALHPHLYRDPEFKAMLMQEARLAARIRHPNVVPTLDVVSTDAELFIVMEYVEGESLSVLRKAARQKDGVIPPTVCAAIMSGVLHGLHAAHVAENEKGEPLDIVHRDVSPQNILVGTDGIARVLDFGVAKALQSRQETRTGQVKGKSSYMAPEQVRAETLTQRVDIFAASVVFWELLTARRLFGGATDEERVYKVLQGEIPLPSSFCADLSSDVDAVVMKGLARDPAARFETALQMAEAIEGSMSLASQRVVGEWVARIGAQSLSGRIQALRQAETTRLTSLPPAPRSTPPDADEVTTAGDDDSLPTSAHTDYTMGRNSAPDVMVSRTPKQTDATTWWRDKRALFALFAVAAVVVAAIVAVRWQARAGRAAAALPNAVEVNALRATPEQAVPAESADNSEPPNAPSASASPAAPTSSSAADVAAHKSPTRRPTGGAHPSAKPASPRVFRPTEL
jgi:serine/threonine protein kinase